MPKKNSKNQNSRKSSRGRRSGDLVRVPCHGRISNSLTSGLFSQSLAPTLFSTITAISDVFEMYRFTNLKYRMLPAGGTVIPTGSQVCGYLPGVIDTASGLTVGSLIQSRHTCFITERQVTPTPWIKVPRAVLQSYGNWYKTVVGTPDVATEIQGGIYVAGTGTDSFVVEVSAVIEFKDLVVAGATPMIARDRAIIAERNRMLSILHYSPSLPASALRSPSADRSDTKTYKNP